MSDNACTKPIHKPRKQPDFVREALKWLQLECADTDLHLVVKGEHPCGCRTALFVVKGPLVEKLEKCLMEEAILTDIDQGVLQ